MLFVFGNMHFLILFFLFNCLEIAESTGQHTPSDSRDDFIGFQEGFSRYNGFVIGKAKVGMDLFNDSVYRQCHGCCSVSEIMGMRGGIRTRSQRFQYLSRVWYCLTI